jgi:uncharacterized protein (DUF362 family)
MLIESTAIGILRCDQYDRQKIKAAVDQLCNGTGLKVSTGAKVLLKPNLLTGRSTGHLACTHPEFVAAVAEWFVDQGAIVSIGDSPAFGTAKGVMAATGITGALQGLPVRQVNFTETKQVRLAGGISVNIAREALECDMLVNLPKIKAHSQLYVTLAVKNYFGTVVGFQKSMWHLRYGNMEERFASNIVDLLAVLPGGISLVDGITAMHTTGPVSGEPYPLGLLAGSLNPVTVDTAFLKVLGLEQRKSIIWQECVSRALAGANHELLTFPFLNPLDVKVSDFRTPGMLKPVSFNPLRMIVSGTRRLISRIQLG